MCSLPGQKFAMLARSLGNTSQSRSRCEALSQAIETVASHQEMTNAFRVAELVLAQLECSMDCVKICAVPAGTATGIGTREQYCQSLVSGMCSGYEG